MNVTFKDHNDTPERMQLIEKVLPKKTIISSILEPSIEKRLFGVIADCIRNELDIYRQYPKSPNFGSGEKERPVEMVKTFDPRNNETCFMGKAFKANAHMTDAELVRYRNAIGKIHHPIWGDCTLLEIWGGDHFEEHNEMVVGAFRYGMNLTSRCPAIRVHVNPLFQNVKSKDFKLSKAQQEYKDDMDMLLTKAIVFGVKTPKEAMRDRRKSRR